MQEINFVNKGYAINNIPRVLSACIFLCFKPYHSEEAVTIKFRNTVLAFQVHPQIILI